MESIDGRLTCPSLGRHILDKCRSGPFWGAPGAPGKKALSRYYLFQGGLAWNPKPHKPKTGNRKQETRRQDQEPGNGTPKARNKKQEARNSTPEKGDRTPKQETRNRTPNAKKVSLWLPRSFWKQTSCVFIGLRLLETLNERVQQNPCLFHDFLISRRPLGKPPPNDLLEFFEASAKQQEVCL